VKQILCIKLVKYWNKYTEMHGQQNVKKLLTLFTTIGYYNTTLRLLTKKKGITELLPAYFLK